MIVPVKQTNFKIGHYPPVLSVAQFNQYGLLFNQGGQKAICSFLNMGTSGTLSYT